MEKTKPKIALILSLTVLLFTVKSAFWLSYYMVFTDNFIENFCVNTDKPELECDGKCYLSDVLDKKAPDAPKNVAMFLDTELIFTSSSFDTKLVFVECILKKQASYYYNSNYNFQYFKSSFKPPARVV